MEGRSDKIIEKRQNYNLVLGLRLSNLEEISRLRIELSNHFSVRSRIILELKINRDQELKSELIDLDDQINKLAGIY